MKNIFKIHPLTYLIAIIMILTGHFKLYICFTLILFIHEMGHITFSIIFKWNIKRIVILPFGMLLKFEDNLNKPLKEEFIISIMGIIFQTIFIIFIHNEYLLLASNSILLFNLLPIYPLDGAKILNILLNKITSFKNSYFLTLLISYISIIFLLSFFIINKIFFLVLALIPLIFNLFRLVENRNYIFNKFLLERYLFNFNFKKKIVIKTVKDMKRDYYHFIKKDNKLIGEKLYLYNYFNSCK